MQCDGYRAFSVDDEPSAHRIIDHILSNSGLPVQICGTAASSEEALDLIPRLRPHICLLDIHMGDMDGLELGRRLTETLDYRLRIIHVTAYDRFEYAQQAVRLGATDYILKPIREEDLTRAVGRAINDLQSERIEHLELERLQERVKTLFPGASESSSPKETRSRALAKAVRDYIEQHFAEDISLGTAADHVCMSPSYVGSIFKSECGVSFRACLRMARVSKAKELMRDPALNLSEIAEAVGYDNLNYFSQAFLEETGVRPSEYRGSGRRWARKTG